jgi:hypothetical protein
MPVSPSPSRVIHPTPLTNSKHIKATNTESESDGKSRDRLEARPECSGAAIDTGAVSACTRRDSVIRDHLVGAIQHPTSFSIVHIAQQWSSAWAHSDFWLSTAGSRLTRRLRNISFGFMSIESELDPSQTQLPYPLPVHFRRSQKQPECIQTFTAY